jgi:hypothetical protein
MSDMILDVQTLPETIFSKISTEKVKIHEENGSIIILRKPPAMPGRLDKAMPCRA